MWSDHVHVCAGGGADDHKAQTARVEGRARRDERSERFEDGFRGFEGLGGVGEEVFAGCEDEVVGDKSLYDELAFAIITLEAREPFRCLPPCEPCPDTIDQAGPQPVGCPVMSTSTPTAPS